MPSTYLFATKADLEPGIAALQRARPLQCARCEERGCLEDTTIPPFVLLSHREDLDLLPLPSSVENQELTGEETTTLLVCDVDAPIVVEARPYWWERTSDDAMRYQVVSTPVVAFTPGGLRDSSRTIEMGDLTTGYGDPENMRLYKEIEEALLQGFTKFGTYFYGPEALLLGKEGVLYADGTDETWTYADLLELEDSTQAQIQKPERGRLSLNESWDWMEAQGYKVHRYPDGRPDPYPRRPTQNCSMDRGFSMFRSYIDHLDLDRLTIPCTYFGKVRGYQTSFRQTDLSRSRVAGSLFTDCDFSDTDFSEALLANCYSGCTFEGAILKNADFRWSWFEECTFAGATMKGAKLLKSHASMLTLSETQHAEVVWHEETDTGPEVGEW